MILLFPAEESICIKMSLNIREYILNVLHRDLATWLPLMFMGNEWLNPHVIGWNFSPRRLTVEELIKVSAYKNCEHINHSQIPSLLTGI